MEQNVAMQEYQDTGLNSDMAIGTADMLFNRGAMQSIERASQLMAKGRSTIPAHLQESPADCMAVIMQAAQWKMNPFAVAQKTHLVSGTLGYEAQLVNAVINSNAPVTGRIQYEWFGDWGKVLGKFKSRKNDKGKIYHTPNWAPEDEQGLGVKVWATFKDEDEPRVLELLLVQAQVRNSTLWASDPKQQLAYLAVKRWSRLYCPDVIMGVYTPDELEPAAMRDMGDAQVVTSVDDLLPGDQEKPEGQPKEKPPAGPSQADIDGAIKAFASINVTEPMICAYATLQRVGDMSAEDLQKLRDAYVDITKNGKPLSAFFKVEDIDDDGMAVTEEQLVALIDDADSIESLDDIQALLDGLASSEAKERVAGMIGVRRSEFD